jgi:hypothetical protein
MHMRVHVCVCMDHRVCVRVVCVHKYISVRPCGACMCLCAHVDVHTRACVCVYLFVSVYARVCVFVRVFDRVGIHNLKHRSFLQPDNIMLRNINFTSTLYLL